MIQVLIKTESHYTVNRKRIRELISHILLSRGIKGSAEVSVVISGDRLMKKLNTNYRHIGHTTDVLSFSLSADEGSVPFVEPPDQILRLGDIVVSFPQAREEAAEENKLVDDKIDELVEHGLMHLLGQHHEE